MRAFQARYIFIEMVQRDKGENIIRRTRKQHFFHNFDDNLIAFQNIRNLRASEAKDIFIGMVQESEIFEYLETGQHHITTQHKQLFQNRRILLLKKSEETNPEISRDRSASQQHPSQESCQNLWRISKSPHIKSFYRVFQSNYDIYLFFDRPKTKLLLFILRREEVFIVHQPDLLHNQFGISKQALTNSNLVLGPKLG